MLRFRARHLAAIDPDFRPAAVFAAEQAARGVDGAVAQNRACKRVGGAKAEAEYLAKPAAIAARAARSFAQAASFYYERGHCFHHFDRGAEQRGREAGCRQAVAIRSCARTASDEKDIGEG